MTALPPPPSPTDAALLRAIGTATNVSGAYASAPVRFQTLTGASARLVEALRPGGRWVVVTCQTSREPAHAAHLRERSITAAQRFALSLWCDGLDAVWIETGVPDATALRATGLDIGQAEPVGLVWMSDVE